MIYIFCTNFLFEIQSYFSASIKLYLQVKMSLGDLSEMEDSVTQSFQKYNELLSEESLIREVQIH